MPCGVVVNGPKGTGKSFMIHHTAASIPLPIYSLKVDKQSIEQSVATARDIVSEALTGAPSILLIENIELLNVHTYMTTGLGLVSIK